MSSERNVIDLTEVTKTYRMHVGRARVREMIPPPFDRPLQSWFGRWWVRDTFNALEDVSMSVEAGASVGIVGPNGAGKTTLLKIISAVTAPTTGLAVTRGRVAALIDVLVGFHPDLTGIENAYLMASMFGVSRRLMTPRIDQVLDFAEIDGEFADTPVKRYSAGMMSRLGFAIIASVDARVLLVDEVLAVGDAAFQRKCVRWLEDYRESDGTLMFVSHNLGLVRSMTDRCIWLDHGRVVESDATGSVLARYGKAMERRGQAKAPVHGGKRAIDRQVIASGLDRWGAGGARVEAVHIDQDDVGGVELSIDYTVDTSLDDALFCFGLIDEMGRDLGAATSPPMRLRSGQGKVLCSIDALPLRPGVYFPVVGIVSQGSTVHDRWRLDRAIVMEANGEVELTDFGPFEIASVWAST
jgi:ABC-type polysaccharide/polyol phosphate transport system ATPase subunit